jgi:cell division protein FtsB
MEENKNKEIIILNELYNVLKKQEFNLVDRIKIYYNTLLGIENNNNQDYLDNLEEENKELKAQIKKLLRMIE